MPKSDKHITQAPTSSGIVGQRYSVAVGLSTHALPSLHSLPRHCSPLHPHSLSPRAPSFCVQTAPPLWYCYHMSFCHHSLSPSLPPLGSLVRVHWYTGPPEHVAVMSGIVMTLEPQYGTVEVLVTCAGSRETWIRRCPLRELEVVEQ